MSLTITFPTGTRELDAYRVLSDPIQFELDGETNNAGQLVAYGDRGRRPAPLEIMVSVQGASLETSMNLVDTIITEAKAATSVTFHKGNRVVDGILTHRFSADGALVRLTLAFNPTGGTYT